MQETDLLLIASKPAALSQSTTAKGKKSPVIRRSARNANKERPNYSFTTTSTEAPETHALSVTTLSGASTAPSSLPEDSPSTGNLDGTKETIDHFVNCFPGGHERENVSGESLLCGLRAVSRSLQLQFEDIVAPTVNELHTIAKGREVYDAEVEMLGAENVRPLENNYSIDHLALTLKIWCRDNQQDLVLGCLMSHGLVNIYSEISSPSTGVLWIYSSNNGQATADDHTDHYEALRRRTVLDSTNGQTSSIPSKKRGEFLT